MKNNEQIRYGAFELESINEEERTAEFVISSEAVDSYGTVFKADGWQLERYMANPVVTYQHDDFSSNPDMLIGTSEVRMQEGKLIAKLRFEAAEDNPLAEKVFRKVKNGILRGASIRASVQEGRMGEKERGEDKDVLYFTKQELLSWSPVVVPSNSEALARSAEAVNTIKKELTPKAAPEGVNVGENKTMSRFEAQLVINKNQLK